ncbi:MAG: hypothetical protein AMJ84_11610 [Acidithiobacillales bacterium SM23_46]|jgi:hypothetical protein|nr:MAG: hypothetical protein AMS22_12310 [Thiotrichales bacterium SG8_50]KPK68187.1 MAG: hypothetical protein AMJ84_11610 [Acidithiobacillales bacterium SM23_46]KPL28675.1 MAG: hypothetical protein AMJ72_02010 [Acidithiobacillales bacterium SM1_46]
MQAGKRARRERDAQGYYQNYAEYNRTLRAWFVVFGVGGPATLIVNRDLTANLAQAGTLAYVVALFLIGAGAQVLIALVNKTASWYAYAAELHPELAKTPNHRFWAWVNQRFILDVVMDLTSIITFALAIWELFRLFT